MEAGGGGISKLMGTSGISCCLVSSAFCCLAFKLSSSLVCDKIDGKNKACTKTAKFSLWLAILSIVAAICLGCITGELAPLFKMTGMDKSGGHGGGHNGYGRRY